MTVYNHTGQVVTDLQRSRTFYEQVLGFRFWFELDPPEEATATICSLEGPLGVRACYLTLDGFTLELIRYAEPGVTAEYRERAMNDPGLTHISISVDDVRATARTAAEYGGQVIESSDIGDGLFIRDPDGQLIELLDRGFRDRLPPRPAG